jgi:hypothetical protein
LEESVRLYQPSEFVEVFRQSGLEIDAFYGDFSGAPLGSDRPRMIAAGRKAGARA